jgi:hypothetical protein
MFVFLVLHTSQDMLLLLLFGLARFALLLLWLVLAVLPSLLCHH